MVRYYKSVVCPRCLLTDRLVDRLREARPEVEIEVIEVLAQPVRALKDRILMVPTLVVGPHRWHHAPQLDEIMNTLDEITAS